MHGGIYIGSISITIIIFLLFFVETGLQEALLATSSLYDNNIETLSKLNINDILKIFKGATIVELMLEPGITVLQMAMKAKCFLTDSNNNLLYLLLKI